MKLKPVKLLFAATIAFAIAFAIVIARGAYEYSGTNADIVAFDKTTVLVATPISLTDGAKKFYARYPASPQQTPMRVSVDPVRALSFVLTIASVMMVAFYAFNRILRYRREAGGSLANLGL